MAPAIHGGHSKEYAMDHFPSWMLQRAHNYLKAAEVLNAQNLPHVVQVNAEIGMEILLKSFISVPASRYIRRDLQTRRRSVGRSSPASAKRRQSQP
ncbi:hypothetical protein EMIT0P74_100248 [Pseudomonas sp. IT-P74]